MTTLNQVIDRIRSLALSHKQIRSFYFGDVPEFDANGEIVYAACFLEAQPGVIDNDNRLQRFNFRMYLVDLVPESTNSEENETEVLSDMSSVETDMLSLMMKPAYQDEWQISAVNQRSLGTELLNDMGAGVYFDFSVSLDFLADACEVPATPIDPNPDFDMARTKLLEYEADGTETDSFDVAGITGLNIWGVWRAGSFKKPIIGTPTDTEKIGFAGTDATVKGVYVTSDTVSLGSNQFLIAGEKINFAYHG